MADAAFASQSRVVTEPTRFERAPVRGTNPSLRPQAAAHTFASRFPAIEQTGQNNEAQPAGFIPQEGASSSGLLANGTGLLLAETRTAEANATFVAPTRVGTALNSYREAQIQIRENLQGRGTGLSNFVQVTASSFPVGARTGEAGSS